MRMVFQGVIPIMLAAVLAAPVASQTPDDVRIMKTRTTQFGGGLGVIMRLVPGVDETEQEVTLIHGSEAIIRTDATESSTVIDFEKGQFIVEDHEDRSYLSYTFQDLAAAVDSVYTAAAQSEPGATQQPEDPGVEYEVSAEVQRPGDTKPFQDTQLELVRLIVTATPVRATDIDPSELPTYVMVSDQWMAREHPGAAAMERLHAVAADQFRETLGTQSAGNAFLQAFQMNNALRESYEGLSEELAEIEGIPLEHTTAFVALQSGAELDLEAAMTDPLAGPEIDFGKLAREGAKDAAKDVAQDAVRSRLGRFGRALGRNRDEEPEEAEAPVEPMPLQAVIIRSVEITESVEVGPIEAGWTGPREGYTKRASPLINPGG